MFGNQAYQNQPQHFEGGDLQLGEHNLFNEYDPALQYRSIFRYFQIPKDDSTMEDGSSKTIGSAQKLVSFCIILCM